MLLANWVVRTVKFVTEVLKMPPKDEPRPRTYPEPVNNIVIFFFRGKLANKWVWLCNFVTESAYVPSTKQKNLLERVNERIIQTLDKERYIKGGRTNLFRITLSDCKIC